MEHVNGTIYRFQISYEGESGSLNRLIDFSKVSAVYDDTNGQVYVLVDGKGFRVPCNQQEAEQAFLDAHMGSLLNE